MSEWEWHRDYIKEKHMRNDGDEQAGFLIESPATWVVAGIVLAGLLWALI
jgi:hypothetical protein